MTKKKEFTKTQIKIVSFVVVLLFVVLIYFAINYDIHEVQEDSLAETSLISPNQALEYNTEFCANKLTELIYEVHFFEKDIFVGEEISEKNILVQNEEKEIISIEKRELEEVKEEFENYKRLCDEFDVQPTGELCKQFLAEAKVNLERSQQNLESSDSILSWMEISHKELRRANRIYNELNDECLNFNVA